MNKIVIQYGQSIDTYKVTGIYGMTDTQIINACDMNNWGGTVQKTADDTAIVQVYKD